MGLSDLKCSILSEKSMLFIFGLSSFKECRIFKFLLIYLIMFIYLINDWLIINRILKVIYLVC